MSKEKQIEEIAFTDVDILANDINQHCADLTETYCGDTHCVACLAHALTEKGYRKQSELAREIFEEIERELYFGDNKDLDIRISVKIAELKKKYTEEGK